MSEAAQVECFGEKVRQPRLTWFGRAERQYVVLSASSAIIPRLL